MPARMGLIKLLNFGDQATSSSWDRSVFSVDPGEIPAEREGDVDSAEVSEELFPNNTKALVSPLLDVVWLLSRLNLLRMWGGHEQSNLLRLHARQPGFASSHFFFRWRQVKQPVLVRGYIWLILERPVFASNGKEEG